MSSLTIASLLKMGLRDDNLIHATFLSFRSCLTGKMSVILHSLPCKANDISMFHLKHQTLLPFDTLFPDIVMPHSPKYQIVILQIFFVQY
jgi:hypothetical protein